MLQGNDSLPLLQKRANVNYNSEQAVAEMVEAIGVRAAMSPGSSGFTILFHYH